MNAKLYHEYLFLANIWMLLKSQEIRGKKINKPTAAANKAASKTAPAATSLALPASG